MMKVDEASFNTLWWPISARNSETEKQWRLRTEGAKDGSLQV